METLLKPMPGDLDQRLRDRLAEGEAERIRVASDMDADGNYGSRWVVVTDRQVLVMSEGDGDVSMPMTAVSGARTEGMVGGGRLEVERADGPPVFVPYSNSLADRFSEVARGIEQLRKGEPFLVRTDLDRTRCETCGRLLPEKNGICPACLRRLDTLGRIARYLRPYWPRALAMALASVVMTFSNLIPPMITRRIVDDVLAPGEGVVAALDVRLRLLGWLVLGLVGVRVLSWAAELARGWTVTWLSARVTADIRNQLYRQLEMLSLQFYDKRQVGGLMSRVTRDSGMLQEFLVDGLPYLAVNGLMILGILGFLLWMSWQLTLYILAPVPVIIGLSFLFWRRMRGIFHKYGQNWGRLSARLNEALSGIRVVKAFAQETREIRSFEARNADLTEISVRTAKNWFVFMSTMGLVTGFGMLTVWFFGGMEVMAGTLTLGTLMAFYGFMWLLYGPLQWFSEVNSWMTRAFAGAERIFEVIDSPAEAYEDPDAVPMTDLEGRVAFRDVTFGYDKSKPVLHHIDLDVRPGEMIGLVGKSGVGKTTTVNLICRFYDVDQGGIEIDGVDVRKIRLRDLRSQIGIVLQEPFLFSGTIAENIGYGRPGARFEEILEAARVARAHDFIVAKPDGYDTQVGERGGNLSGGERQRVSIARAVLHNPKILILDEATSSVDAQTEKRIQEAVVHLVAGRTTFAIAHRLATLRNADRLVVLDGGRVVEVGTHQELLEKQGVFYNLVQLQQQVAQIIAVKE